MADLPIIAGVMNDTEISANAPLTETLMRRIGSNINFLLEFLGINDGDTVATGQLSDLVTAINTVDAHTITKQGTFSGGSNLIGTYSPIKFVNRVFWTRREIGNGNGPTAAPRALLKQLDGGASVMFEANPVTPTNTNTFAAEAGAIDLVTDRIEAAQNTYPSAVTGPGVYARYFDGAIGVIGFESPMRDRDWTKIGILNWRDFNTQAIVRSYHEPVASQMHVYMSYEFDLKSAGFYAT